MQVMQMNPIRFPHTSRTVDHPRSIADQIYETLRSEIIKREVEPGHRLFEVEVAKTFDASRTPVREAFRRLEQDGLAERLAQGGIRVIQLDEQTIEDLFNLRRLLETHAIELACERITAEEIAILKQVRAQANELLKSGDINNDFALDLLFDLNSQFHDTIYSATRSKFLAKVIVNIRAVVLSLRTLSIRLDSVRQVWDEHSELIDCLEQRDKTAALRLINRHIYHTASQILSFVRSQKPGDPEDAPDPSSTQDPIAKRDRKQS